MKVSVLRIGHRVVRDDRVTTHAALVARAFGADVIYMTDADNSIVKSIEKVCDRWGKKDFRIEIITNWRKLIDNHKQQGTKIIHLTMYGINVDECIDEINQKKENLLVVISAEKAPKDIYFNADYNIAIGNQPHSEISALALFLDRIFNGLQLKQTFNDAKVKIIPMAKGKRVIKKDESEFPS